MSKAIGGAKNSIDTNGTQDIFVAGRLCLFGEHSDWAGSYSRINAGVRPGRTIVIGTEQGLYCRIRALPEPVLKITATTAEGHSLGLHVLNLAEPETLLETAYQGGFWSYAAGTAHKVFVEHNISGGLEIDNHRTTLPFKKGLSSSAAICVVVARAFNRIYNLNLSTRGEMEAAYAGERLTPSLCGRMDQCGAFGSIPLLMRFEGDSLHCEQLKLGGTLHMLLVDLRSSKDTVSILGKLQAAYPHAETVQHANLHELLGAINESITTRAEQLLAAGDARQLGALMREAQQEFDVKAMPVCPEHLTSPVLHRVLDYEPLQHFIWGGKGVGSQGDGTAQLICRDEHSQQMASDLLERELSVHCTKLTLSATQSPATATKKDNASVLHELREEEQALQDQLRRVRSHIAASQESLRSLSN